MYVILNETQIDINNNRSKIEYNVYCQSNGSGWFTGSHTRKFILNGTTYINETSNISCKSPNAYINIASGVTDYITHNNDGSKTVSFEAVIQGSTYGVSAEISGTIALTTLARASSISCTTANIGETSIIVINSVVPERTHNVFVSFNGIALTILTDVKGGTYSWTIPESFYSKIPNAKLGTGVMSVDTYNGNTLVGSKAINFTVMTNAETCKPNLSATVVDNNSSTIAITGDKNKLVRYKSTAKVQITASAKNSATLSVKRVNGQVVSGDTINIENIENNSFDIEVVDSRGYSNTITVTKTMIEYIPLSINASAIRKNPTSSETLLSFSGNYFNSKIGTTTNTLQVSWKYKIKNATEYSTAKTITPTITNNTFAVSKISLGSLFNYQNAYDIQLIAKDKLSTVTTSLTLTQGIPVINWGKDFFNVNGDIQQNGTSIKEILNKINEATMLLSSSNVISITPSGATNHTGFGGSYYYKTGTRVHVHLGIKMNTTTRSEIFNMPAGFRPKGTICVLGGGADGNVPDISSVEILEDGRIFAKSNTHFVCINTEYDAFN